MKKLLEKVFGSYSEREIKRLKPIVDAIDALEPKMQALSDEELRAKTDEFRERLQKGETLDDLLVEAFAVVREASKRVLGMRHYPVQLMGGIVLHQGRIAEMRTGEGKTLVSTTPAYLNALEGKGVHIVTVNDYLATRDREWMGRVHEFLGLTVGVITNDMEPEERKAAYACDITYGTNNEFGFDYLRDNMVIYAEQRVQRGLNYGIIDEVDSVLIDEARTPLIISGQSAKSTNFYRLADMFVRTLKKGKILNEEDALNNLIQAELQEEGDFVVDEKGNAASLTQEGVQKAERFFGIDNLADPEYMEVQHHINQALRAHNLMKLDKDYVINEEQEIVIVDEFTGRLMPGRRYSDGLHQAIEAKEGVKIARESKTLATVTFQNFFNKYKKKSGMTGTGLTEELEFREIYGLDVVVIPTNRPIQRVDSPDSVYKTEKGKFKAVVRDIIDKHQKGRPVLVGTVSIERSEILSKMLKKEGIKHTVLNAKYHKQEAEIVSQAGQYAAVTIATNMAGRGTDIILGEGVKEIGGLHIIGTERHESRRIDNQLRGRAGRQGDPGSSQFFISLEDDLMRLFGSERIIGLVDKLGLEEDEAIEHSMLTKAIENAQKKVEANNFSIRKHLLDYDKVMNEQRETIYGERTKVLEGENLKDNVISMIQGLIIRSVDSYTGESEFSEEWDFVGLRTHLAQYFSLENELKFDEKEREDLSKESLKNILTEAAISAYEKKEEQMTPEQMREIERVLLLRVIDQKWMDHIDNIDQMRQGIGLRAYGQRNPVIEYQFVAFEMFEEMLTNIQEDTIRALYHVEPAHIPEREQVVQETATNKEEEGPKQPTRRDEPKINRNDPCPCGSGKKYKHCCGREA